MSIKKPFFYQSMILLIVGMMVNSIKASVPLIDSVEVRKNSLRVIVHGDFKRQFLLDDFFAEYDEDIDLEKLDPSIQIVPFVLNILPIIWISGQDFSVDSFDEDLFSALTVIKKIFVRMYPKTSWNGNLIPKKLIKNKQIKKNPAFDIALLFSGGLDSLASSFFHLNSKQLLITAWGQWDVPLEKIDVWQVRKKEIIEFASKYGHTNAFIKSNFAANSFLNWEYVESLSPEIKDWRIDTTEGMGLFGLSIPILISKGYLMLRIASSYTWNYPYPSAANPFVDDNLVCADNIHLKHDLFNLTRLEKVELIAQLAKERKIAIPRMKVCDDQRVGNCCEMDCSKCLQTVLAVLALDGDIKSYGFDCSREEIIKLLQAYLLTDLSYWVLWNIKQIKKRLESSLKQGQNVPEDLQWLLTIPLGAHLNNAYVTNKTIVDWTDYKDLAPSDLVIPSCAPEYLM